MAKSPAIDVKDITDALDETYARRYARLLALNIDPDAAVTLIDTPDIAHEAEQLYEKGCPPDLIVKILS